MNLKELIKHLTDMGLLYEDRVILTMTDGQKRYKIKEISGTSCAEFFEPKDRIAEVTITIKEIL